MKKFLGAAVIILLATSSAFALDLSVQMKQLNGEPFIENNEPVTLKRVIVTALTAQYPDEQTLSGQVKFDRYRLAMKVQNEKDPVLSVEELKMVKELIGKGFNAIIVGQAWKAIDPSVQ